MTKKEKILHLLKNKPTVTQQELNDIAYRYGNCIFELRKEGHIINTIQIKKGHFNYKYCGKEGATIYETARRVREEKDNNLTMF